jgi:hypothetical protein
VTAEFWCGKEGGPAKSSAEVVIVIHASSCHPYQHKSANSSPMPANITQFQQSISKSLNTPRYSDKALKSSFLNIKIAVDGKGESAK